MKSGTGLLGSPNSSADVREAILNPQVFTFTREKLRLPALLCITSTNVLKMYNKFKDICANYSRTIEIRVNT
jgi:hypothetical protein